MQYKKHVAFHIANVVYQQVIKFLQLVQSVDICITPVEKIAIQANVNLLKTHVEVNSINVSTMRISSPNRSQPKKAA